MVLESAEGDLVRVLLAHVQAEPSNGRCRKHGKDAAAGRASDVLVVEIVVISTVALLCYNLPEQRLERRRKRFSKVLNTLWWREVRLPSNSKISVLRAPT